MEPPTIPRMPPFQWTAFWIGVVLLIVYYVLMDVLYPWQGLLVVLHGGVYAALFVVIVSRRGLLAWRVRRVVHYLRRFDSAQRSTILAHLNSEQAQAYLE